MTIATPNILSLGLITIALALTACGGGGGSGSGGSTTTSVSSKADSSLSTSVSTSVVSSIVATSTSSNSSSSSADMNAAFSSIPTNNGTLTFNSHNDFPDAFTFTPEFNVPLNSINISNTITVSGIDDAVPITITGGEYSINGGAFTSAEGSVTNGQTITVKAVALAGTELTQNAEVDIGGVSGTYAVTTLPDTTAPVAEFKFPTPYTMTEALGVKVRGTATDEHAITSVKVIVNGTTEIPATPKATGDFSSWTAEVPLTALSENEIKVVATDDRNNVTVINDANKVVIRQAKLSSAFPNEVNEFDNVYTGVLDNVNHRVLVADRGKVWAVDIKTGNRTVFSDHESMCNGIQYGLLIDQQTSKVYGSCNERLYEFNLNDGSFSNKYTPDDNFGFVTYNIALDRASGRNRLVIVDNVYEYEDQGGKVIGFSLDSKEFSIISEGNEQPHLKGARGGIVVNGNDYLVTSGGQHEDANIHRVISVNAITGKHTAYTDNTIGSGELFSALLPNGNTANLTGMVIDEKNNKLIVIESLSGKLLSIDMKTGERILLANITQSSVDDIPLSSEDLDLDDANRLLYVAENLRNEILIVDLETTEKVILSKSKDNF